ncbi:hypothetical protein PG994_004142 [Apiospora phragmitis]|uniref:Uncharacterized protein n=1 Tax=Apiospora phragmitis TaxID=2905665 RepID=A0ABR1VPR5_9PEZI
MPATSQLLRPSADHACTPPSARYTWTGRKGMTRAEKRQCHGCFSTLAYLPQRQGPPESPETAWRLLLLHKYWYSVITSVRLLRRARHDEQGSSFTSGLYPQDPASRQMRGAAPPDGPGGTANGIYIFSMIIPHQAPVLLLAQVKSRGVEHLGALLPAHGTITMPHAAEMGHRIDAVVASW